MAVAVKAGKWLSRGAGLPHLPQFAVDWLALAMTGKHIRDMFRFDHGFLKQFPA
jgi:hypothetical protein